jgi:hypothetical protein
MGARFGAGFRLTGNELTIGVIKGTVSVDHGHQA